MANVRSSHKSGFILRGGVQRRQTLWISIAETRSTLAAANTAIIMNSGGASVLALRPFTVVRSRGTFHVVSDQTGALENFSGAFGAAIVSDQSVAIGVTAVPTPTTDASSDLWYVYEGFMGRFLFISGVGVAQSNQFFRYDSKAMRKVEEGQQIAYMAEADSISSGLVLQHQARVLVKLH